MAVANVVEEVAPPSPSATPTSLPQAPDLIAPTIQPIQAYPPPAAPTNMPSFALPDPDELTRTAEPTAVPTETIIPPTGTATNTPQPTYTPPALPQTHPDEHYWLKRPVAEGGTVWTDKVYPYGSTRGGELRPHHGVEFNVPYNTEILAAASGTVVVAGPDDVTAHGPHTNFYGNLVVLQHDTLYKGQAVYTLYGHLSDIWVVEGQQVDSQTVLGLSGATGVADGPHLHFEVRLGENSYDTTVNPLLWLWPFPDRGTIAGRVIFPDGSPAYEAPVRAVRVDADSRYATTTVYARDTLIADDVWQENFAVDDIEAGYYEVVVAIGEEKYVEEVWVYPRRTAFVEIVISD